jgi:hypothetical protein
VVVAGLVPLDTTPNVTTPHAVKVVSIAGKEHNQIVACTSINNVTVQLLDEVTTKYINRKLYSLTDLANILAII